MLFLVIFEDDISGNFLRGDKVLRTLKRTSRAKSRTNDVKSFRDITKGKQMFLLYMAFISSSEVEHIYIS